MAIWKAEQLFLQESFIKQSVLYKMGSFYAPLWCTGLFNQRTSHIMCGRQIPTTMQSREDAVAQQIDQCLKEQLPVKERNYSVTFINSSVDSLRYEESFWRCFSWSNLNFYFCFENSKIANSLSGEGKIVNRH